MATLTSFLFAQFGLLAAIYANSFDSLSMFTNFLILPLIYLGGVFYPISLLPQPWGQLSHLNPIFYLIDGFRHALIGVGDLPLWLSFVVGGSMSLVAFGWAAVLIGRGYRLRN
jgi:ABC-2 type transport system permease protein